MFLVFFLNLLSAISVFPFYGQLLSFGSSIQQEVMNFKLNIIVSALDLSLWSSCARGGYALHDSYVDGTINVGNSSAAMMLSIGTYGTKITSAHDPKHKLYVMDASDDGTYNTGVVNTNEKMPIQNTVSKTMFK